MPAPAFAISSQRRQRSAVSPCTAPRGALPARRKSPGRGRYGSGWETTQLVVRAGVAPLKNPFLAFSQLHPKRLHSWAYRPASPRCLLAGIRFHPFWSPATTGGASGKVRSHPLKPSGCFPPSGRYYRLHLYSAFQEKAAGGDNQAGGRSPHPSLLGRRLLVWSANRVDRRQPSRVTGRKQIALAGRPRLAQDPPPQLAKALDICRLGSFWLALKPHPSTRASSRSLCGR